MIVVGSINVDMTCQLDKWPRVHETVYTTGFNQFLGGKGVNQAASAARLGASVTFIGALGLQTHSEFVLEVLDQELMDLELVEFPDEPTGMAFIDIGPSSENIIRLVSGANGLLNATDINDRKDVFSPGGVLLLQNEVPLEVSLAAAKIARSNGMLVLMDPVPSPPSPWPREVIEMFYILTPNAVEAEFYCGVAPATPDEGQQAAKEISLQLGCDIIVTMGADGVARWKEGSGGWSPAPPTEPVDTVAAGDCFNGALAKCIAAGADWSYAIKFAVRAASFSTTRSGALASLPSADEISISDSTVPV